MLLHERPVHEQSDTPDLCAHGDDVPFGDQNQAPHHSRLAAKVEEECHCSQSPTVRSGISFAGAVTVARGS